MDVQHPEMRLVVIEGLSALADERLTPSSEADEAEFFDIIEDRRRPPSRLGP